MEERRQKGPKGRSTNSAVSTEGNTQNLVSEDSQPTIASKLERRKQGQSYIQAHAATNQEGALTTR